MPTVKTLTLFVFIASFAASCSAIPVVLDDQMLKMSIDSESPCDSAPCISILDTGEPDADLATGGIVWRNQSLGIRFRFLDVFPNGSLLSIAAYLSTSRVSQGTGGNFVYLSLCKENVLLLAPGLCISNASFKLYPTDRMKLTWAPDRNMILHKGQFYWFVIRGSALSEDSSVTWFDGNKRLSPSSDALIISSHTSDGANWIVDSKADGKSELPTTLVLVRR
jgi:hypothetical protein